MQWWYGLIMAIVSVAFAVFCGLFAQRKGYSVFWFTVLGLLFNVITFVVILVLPNKYQTGDW
jgi:hypothetical protein